jgi:hypothetical protein
VFFHQKCGLGMSRHVNNQAGSDINLSHLQAELARIDILLHREIWRWQLANQDPTDPFRGFAVSHQEAEALVNRNFATSWGQTVTLPPDRLKISEEAYAVAVRQAGTVVKRAQKAQQPLRLARLADVFKLNQFEIDVLLICLAPTVDKRYEKIYGYLQDHVARIRPSVELVLNLLAAPGPGRLPLLAYFGPEAALIKNQILTLFNEAGQSDAPLVTQNLGVDKAIVSWLLGSYHPPEPFGPNAALLHPARDEPFSQLLSADIRHTLEQHGANVPLFVFYGRDRGAQQIAARFIAARLGQPLLMVDLVTANSSLTPLHLLRSIFRDALLNGAIPCLLGWDTFLEEDKTADYLLNELCSFPGALIVAGQKNWQSGGGLDRERVLFWQEFAIPISSSAIPCGDII